MVLIKRITAVVTAFALAVVMQGASLTAFSEGDVSEADSITKAAIVTEVSTGQVLYEHVCRSLEQLERGEDKLRAMNGLEGGVLRVGASDMTLKFFLLDYIERFKQNYPLVRITVTNAPTPRSLRSLREGIIDFAVVSGPLEPESGVACLRVRAAALPYRALRRCCLFCCRGRFFLLSLCRSFHPKDCPMRYRTFRRCRQPMCRCRSRCTCHYRLPCRAPTELCRLL